MHGVRIACGAVLFQFHPVGMDALVFRVIVVTVLAFLASHNHFDPVTASHRASPFFVIEAFPRQTAERFDYQHKL
jgi:hypothetical protein